MTLTLMNGYLRHSSSPCKCLGVWALPASFTSCESTSGRERLHSLADYCALTTVRSIGSTWNSGFSIVGALLRASVAPGSAASSLPECLIGGVELFLAY